MMSHPGIARILDAGATKEGRPYFVMEYVPGVSIVEYCDDKRLGVTERLRLFAEVCRAVQHEHRKGVIHRDLKPSNILVAEQDGSPSIKVIDFGVAKATSRRLGEQTLHTELGRRTILEQQSPAPSKRLGGRAAAGSEDVAGRRDATVSALRRRIEGELDWIALCAVSKDRRRRYQTALAFAEDIERHLRGEAVWVSSPSKLYRLQKFSATTTSRWPQASTTWRCC